MINAVSLFNSSHPPYHSSLRASFPALPNALFNLVSNCLTQSEIARLPPLCHETRHLTTSMRKEVKDLNLANHPNRTPLTPEHLRNALRVHPNFNRINLSGFEKISIELCDILTEVFKSRSMKGLIAVGTSFEDRPKLPTSWQEILWALDPEELNGSQPSQLEHIDLTDAISKPGSIIDGLLELVARCPHLKLLKIPLQPSYCWQNGLALLRSLPSSLEFLGPNWAPLDEEMATEMMQKFDVKKIRSCHLNFNEDFKRFTDEKRTELFDFLPFSSMSEITLQGVRNFESGGLNRLHWPNNDEANYTANYEILSADLIDHIALNLQTNATLEVLNLNGLIPSEELVPAIIRLINSINSEHLRKLTLITKPDAIPDMTLIEKAISAKLPQWKKLKKLQINRLTLHHLKEPLIPFDPTLSPLNAVTALFQAEAGEGMAHQMALNGLFRNRFPNATKITDQISALDQIPIPTIFAHYTHEYNKLALNQIKPREVLGSLRLLAIPAQNLNWAKPNELIRLLENLLNRKREGLNRLSNVACRQSASTN